MKNNIVTYESDNTIKKGYLSILPEVIREIIENRWLTFQIFRRDFFAGYKQSFVGIGWTFIVPLMSVGTFIILNLSGVFSAGEIEIPYPLYALLGVSVWNLFANGLVSGSDSLVRAGDMIKKINFSKKSLVIASSGSSLISFLIQLILVGFLFCFYQIMPSPTIWLLPLVIVPLLCLSYGFGFIFALLNSVVRDISRALPMVLTFLMFLTPVLYAKPKSGILTSLTNFNPLYYFISAVRDIALTGKIVEFEGFLVSSVFSVIFFVMSLIVFHLSEAKIAERI